MDCTTLSFSVALLLRDPRLDVKLSEKLSPNVQFFGNPRFLDWTSSWPSLPPVSAVCWKFTSITLVSPSHFTSQEAMALLPRLRNRPSRPLRHLGVVDDARAAQPSTSAANLQAALPSIPLKSGDCFVLKRSLQSVRAHRFVEGIIHTPFGLLDPMTSERC